MIKPLVQVLLDSGAFTAWKTGKDVDLDAYIGYIKTNQAYIANYVSLDCIPGKPGVAKTQAEVDIAAEQSYKNHQYMKRQGLKPIPVFHRGECFSWLDRYLKDGEDYIGIGLVGMVTDASVAVVREWGDKIFNRITDREGYPIVKTHCFGSTSFPFMRRYPWFSCDATSWALRAAYGAIYVPAYKNGLPDYTQDPVMLIVSDKGKADGSLDAKHYKYLGPYMRARLVDFLECEVGVKLEEVANDYEARIRTIIFFFQKFRNAIGFGPFTYRKENGYQSSHSGYEFKRKRLIFATWLMAEYQGRILTEENANDRLISYWELKDKPASLLHEYVTNGRYVKEERNETRKNKTAIRA